MDIALVLQPDFGNRIVIDDTIDNAAQDPAEKVIAVTFPLNVQTRVFLWTR